LVQEGSVRNFPESGRLGGVAGLAAIAWVVVLVFAGSTVPTPLYQLYQQRLHFSEIVLTLIFAAYVGGTLVALLLAGRLSDQIGRRRAALPALVVLVASTIVFLVARSTGLLFLARVLSGFGIGVVAGTTAAWLAELHPKRDRQRAALISAASNTAGLSLGPLFAGFLAEFAPFPLRLVYALYVPVLLIAAGFALATRETVEQSKPVGELSWKPRIGVPKDLRATFVSPAATAFAMFSLAGFYSALIPGLLKQTLHVTNHAIAGGIVFISASAAMVASLWSGSRGAMLTGLGLIFPALALLLLAREVASMVLLILASIAGGAAMGLGYRGSLELVNIAAPDQQRAEMLSAYLAVCYGSVALPVIGVGVLTQIANAGAATWAFACVVAAIAGLGLAANLWLHGKGDGKD
jgi:MFS family permease